MTIWTGIGERVLWGGTDCGDVVSWDGGWRATRPADRGLLPSSWMDASRQFATRQEAVDWLVKDARDAEIASGTWPEKD